MPVCIHTVRTWLSNAYLIESQAGLILVDTGPVGSERVILEAMSEIGRSELRLIFLTHAHFDHCGSSDALRRATGAPVAVHQADAEDLFAGMTRIGDAQGIGKIGRLFLPLVSHFLQPAGIRPDIKVADGDDLSRVGLPAAVIHTPGHTPGSSCLWVEDRLIFAGDLFSTTRGPAVQHFFADDWAKVAASIWRVAALRPERIYPGHGLRPLDEADVEQAMRKAGF